MRDVFARLVAWLTRLFGRRVNLDRRWARHVLAAEADRERFRKAVQHVDDPMIRATLTGVFHRLGDAVESVRQVATHGQQLQEALHRLPNRSFLEHRLGNLVDQGLDADEPRMVSVRSQIETIDRVRAQVVEAERKLAEIDAELDLAVVRAIEAGLNAAERPELVDLRSSVENAVIELDALNSAMIEVGQIGR